MTPVVVAVLDSGVLRHPDLDFAGGQVLFSGTPKELLAAKGSYTAAYLGAAVRGDEI